MYSSHIEPKLLLGLFMAEEFIGHWPTRTIFDIAGEHFSFFYFFHLLWLEVNGHLNDDGRYIWISDAVKDSRYKSVLSRWWVTDGRLIIARAVSSKNRDHAIGVLSFHCNWSQVILSALFVLCSSNALPVGMAILKEHGSNLSRCNSNVQRVQISCFLLASFYH